MRAATNRVYGKKTLRQLSEAGLRAEIDETSGPFWITLLDIAPEEVGKVMRLLNNSGSPGSAISERVTAKIFLPGDTKARGEAGGQAEYAAVFTRAEPESGEAEAVTEETAPDETESGEVFDIGLTESAASPSPWRGFAPRVFEWGINFDAGFANNWIGWEDVFNSQRSLILDLSKLPAQKFGVAVSAEPRTWLKVQSRGKHEIGITLTAGLDIDGYLGLSPELTDSIARGRLLPFSGAVEAGASVFAALELRGSAAIGRWRFFAAPEVYLPLLYMEPPDIHANAEIDGTLKGEMVAEGAVFTAFDMNGLDSLDISGVLGHKGVNISLGAEYALFDFLDVGGSVSHIPLVPAVLTNKASFKIGYDISPDGSGLLNVFDNLFQEREDSSLDLAYGEGSLTVYRPLRFDAFCVYKPFGFRMMNIAFRGNVGFSMMTVYGACFNFGVSARADFLNMFGLELKSGYTEALWRHGVSLTANMKVIELDCGLAVQSQDFVRSFRAAGLQAVVGVKAGF
jgi:hypothetical protein